MQLFPFQPERGPVWFKDEQGSVFHLAVTSVSWPGAYNGPDSPHDLTHAKEHVIQDGNLLNLIFPDGGRITADFTAAGRKGNCCRCGLCCSACPNLVLLKHGKHGGLGEKNGTACAIYNRRLYKGFKGCVIYPERFKDIKDFSACTMRFR